MNDWLVQQRDKKELESQTLQSELKFLKSQINPHFLFNTLNSLYALTLKKSDLAPEIVLKLSEMMRYMLYECNEKEVPLNKEINYMKNYLELEKLRHGAKMLIDFKVNGEIINQKIAPLILIPFIENSFKHGINNQVSVGFVNLELNVYKNDLNMILENSKSPSLPKPSGKKSGGIGLANVKRRMAILYPENHSLDIIESPNTYKIELNLNLVNQ
jgi:LytS/YehU family sensor histidine kinase